MARKRNAKTRGDEDAKKERKRERGLFV